MSTFLKVKFLLVMMFVLVTPSVALPYQYVEVTKVGLIRVFSELNQGVNNAFTRADGTDFPHCSTLPDLMWNSDASTSEGKKSVLAILAFAKATGAEVTVYYDVDSNGYCRYEVVDIH